MITTAEPSVPQLTQHTADTIRDLIHLTRFHDALTGPAELGRALADLTTMTTRLPQLLDQLHRWLRHEHDIVGLHADNDAEPADLARLAATHLGHASRLAQQLSAALDTAHQATTHLATGPGDTDQEPNHQPKGVKFRPQPGGQSSAAVDNSRGVLSGS
jgi:hypothetical protein